MKRGIALLFVFVLISCLITACGGGGGNGGGSGTTNGIGPAGGTVTSSDAMASVTIPAGALSQEIAITVEAVSSPVSGNIGTAYEFGPSGTVFSQAVTISITYDETTLLPGQELNLKLAKLVNNQWQQDPNSSVDQGKNVVSGSTNSFSIYGVIVGTDQVNTMPTADAGSDQNVAVGSLVTLDGSKSTDTDGDSITYHWTMTTEPSGSDASLSDPTSVNPTFTADRVGIYVVSLIVNDGTVDSTPDSVTIAVSTIPFTEYVPLNPQDICLETYEWTYGPDTGQQYTSTISGPVVVPYTSGAITGVKRTFFDGDPASTLVLANNGVDVKFLALDDYYISTDCSLTAHPPEWSFSTVFDGMIKDQPGSYFVVNQNDLSDCVAGDTDQKILFSIQDVTVNGTLYPDAVILWYLDLNFPFTTLDFQGKENDLGITLPDSSDTQGYSVTHIEIFGFEAGSIATGDIDAETGVLLDLSERISASCTAQPSYTIGGTVSGLTGTGLVLQNNGGDDLVINANGSFTFNTPLISGSPYNVAVSTQPTGQTCSVTNGTGTVNAANVTTVAVTCGVVTTWQAGPPLNTARNQFAGGVINGKIYVFGGNRNPDGLNLKSTEMLDPASGSWVYKADNEDNGGQGVEEVSGAVVNGKLYVFGAWGGGNPFGVFNFVEEYDPATDTWASKAPMPTTRSGAVAVTYNNKIYVFGGSYDYDGDVTGTGRINYDVVEAYDPGNNTWQTITHMPALLQGFAVGVVGDNAYIIGGADDSLQPNVNVYAYNFTTGNWTTSGFAPLPTPGIYPHSSAAPVVNGKIYLIGGGLTLPDGGGDNVDIYDPVSNTWQTDVPLPTPTTGHLSVVVDNKIYVIGGDYGSNATITATVWSLDLSSFNALTATMTTPRAGHTATLLANGKVLITGGGILASAELYDLATGTFSAIGDMGTARSFHTATLLSNGKVLIAGGYNGGALAGTELFQ
jgi:N-acetylneuraminic acid mutarotase